MRTPIVAGLGLMITLTSCAPSAGGADGGTPVRARQCFSVHQVTNFRQGRPDQVFLRVGRDDVYEVNAAGGCGDLDFTTRLAIVPDLGGMAGSRVCTDDSARLIVPGSVNNTAVCRVRITRKLTPEEIASIPAAHRP